MPSMCIFMPVLPPDDQRDRRLHAIREILAGEEVRDQAQLVGLLQQRSLAVTQSAISRDLRQLGAAKIGGRYRLAAVAPTSFGADGSATVTTDDPPLHEIAPWFIGAAPAGDCLVVVRTAIGSAARVGLILDAAGLPEIVGTISGDDTVFIATAGAAEQQRMLQFLRALREDSA